MQLEMIPDLQPDLMSYLGISKLGHFLMIKKRAKDLLSFHSPTDSPALSSSRYSVQMEEGRQGSFSQLLPPYPQSYQIRNYSLSPPLTNTLSNLVPSITMDSESVHSFHSEGSNRHQSFHPTHPVSLPSHTPDSTHPPTHPHSSSLPADDHTSDIVQQSHSIPQTQLSDTTSANHSPPPHPSSSTPPQAVDSPTGPDTRNITPSSDVEIDVQPYTETIFSIPNRKPDSNKLTRQTQSRRTRPTVSTQGSVKKKKKRNANRHKNPVEPLPARLDRSESTTDSLATKNSQSNFSVRIGANPAIVSDASASFSPYNISTPGILFYHSSGGRNRAITPTSKYKVCIPVRRDRNTGITVKTKHRKSRPRKSPVGIKSDADTLMDGDIPGIANTDGKITRTAVTPVETGATSSVRKRGSGNPINLADATQERLSESSALVFEPILSISKLDISHYTLSARTNSASAATLPQPEYRDTDSSIIEVDEVGDDTIPSQLDVQVVHNQFTQSRIDSPSPPTGNDCPHSQDIEMFLTEIPNSPRVEVSDSSDRVEPIPSPYSATEDVPITPADGVEDGSNAEGVQSSVIRSQRKDKSAVLRSGSRRKKETKDTILDVSEESNGDAMHSSVPASTGEVEESSDLTSESTSTRVESRSKSVTAASVPDSESLQQTDNGIGDGVGDESGTTIPSHEDDAPHINSALPDSECPSVRMNHEDTQSDSNQILSVSNIVCLETQSGGGDANGFPQTFHPSEGERRGEEAGNLLVERRRLMGHTPKNVKSKLLTTKRKLKLSTSEGDILVRRKLSKKKIAGRLSHCSEGSAPESVLGRVRREKIKYRGRKYGRGLQGKSMVLLRSEKKPPSLSVPSYKPIKNNFETRGRSTSPETTEDELKNTTKFHRTIPRIPKRYSDTLSAFYPGLREDESAVKPVPVHNTSYSRPQPGVRLPLRDTVVYARQERRSFACFKCASCFETPYQLLQHGMLESCDQLDTRWPEY